MGFFDIISLIIVVPVGLVICLMTVSERFFLFCIGKMNNAAVK
ncbi:hypothetical protein [Candidatus Endomicrobiellum trichonymphae]|nr:hypothetical protein [Candidatus Endomicrobium trichonymphae]